MELWMLVTFLSLATLVGINGLLLIEIRGLCRKIWARPATLLLEHKPEKKAKEAINRKKSSERMKAFWAKIKKEQGQ